MHKSFRIRRCEEIENQRLGIELMHSHWLANVISIGCQRTYTRIIMKTFLSGNNIESCPEERSEEKPCECDNLEKVILEDQKCCRIVLAKLH